MLFQGFPLWLSGLRIRRCCKLWYRSQMWCRHAAAALTQPLAWELISTHYLTKDALLRSDRPQPTPSLSRHSPGVQTPRRFMLKILEQERASLEHLCTVPFTPRLCHFKLPRCFDADFQSISQYRARTGRINEDLRSPS